MSKSSRVEFNLKVFSSHMVQNIIMLLLIFHLSRVYVYILYTLITSKQIIGINSCIKNWYCKLLHIKQYYNSSLSAAHLLSHSYSLYVWSYTDEDPKMKYISKKKCKILVMKIEANNWYSTSEIKIRNIYICELENTYHDSNYAIWTPYIWTKK